MFVENIAL